MARSDNALPYTACKRDIAVSCLPNVINAGSSRPPGSRTASKEASMFLGCRQPHKKTMMGFVEIRAVGRGT